MDEALVRVVFFLAILTVMFLWEHAAPRRDVELPKQRRWICNLGIGALNVVILRLLFPFLGFALAVQAAAAGWGLFNYLPAPSWISFAVSIVLLDLLIYFQHRVFHAAPVLWPLHRMHHADTSFDTATGVRFHPLEAVISMLIKSAAIVALGVPPLAYAAFEVILSGTSLFNHGNVRIPESLDRIIRLVLVTPDMHRVHHSVDGGEHNRNFGFNLACWDRLFGTYKAQPDAGHRDMTIGLEDFRDPGEQRLDRLLSQPFRTAR
jgi:sterol desaturase/sphingolipid hydroxylase (fatty acid hydroxylase superfamily)